jgi:hypothetical protein
MSYAKNLLDLIRDSEAKLYAAERDVMQARRTLGTLLAWHDVAGLASRR